MTVYDGGYPPSVAPGWYLHDQDPGVERYWNGGTWAPGARVAAPGTPAFPTHPGLPLPSIQEGHYGAEDAGDRIDSAPGWLNLVAVLITLGALVGGIILMTATVQVCTSSLYGSGVDCNGTRHPFVWVGLGTLIGGLIQAAAVRVIAKLCNAVTDLRSDVARLQQARY